MVDVLTFLVHFGWLSCLVVERNIGVVLPRTYRNLARSGPLHEVRSLQRCPERCLLFWSLLQSGGRPRPTWNLAWSGPLLKACSLQRCPVVKTSWNLAWSGPLLEACLLQRCPVVKTSRNLARSGPSLQRCPQRCLHHGLCPLHPRGSSLLLPVRPRLIV